MALDALKGYLQLASGLGDLTRAKATEVADGLLALSSSVVSTPAASQVASLADELMSAAAVNRESLKALVRAEVESAVAHALAAVTGQFGRVSPDAPAAGHEQDRQLKDSTATQPGSPVSSPIIRSEVSMATTKTAPAKKAVVKKAAPATKAASAKKAATTKVATTTQAAPARKAVVKKAAPTKAAPAKKAATTKAAPAKKAATTKAAPAKKAATTKAAPAKKAVVKKSVPATKTTATKTTAKKAAAKK